MSNTDISIITAFFDIGRSDWTPDKGLPHYLHRTTDTYMERFSHLATLENEMVIFTSPDLVDRVMSYRKGKEDRTKVIPIDYANILHGQKHEIASIQQSEYFQNLINPNQIRNPEYWSVDYVLINICKSNFVYSAIKHKDVTNELVAWIDFGYCRSIETLGGITKWTYPFDPNKIHLFNFREYKGQPISQIIANNIVYMFGAKIVAGHEKWRQMEELIRGAFDNLCKAGMIDDDQTLMLLAYTYDSKLFELHPIDEADPFVAFRKFNEIVS